MKKRRRKPSSLRSKPSIVTTRSRTDARPWLFGIATNLVRTRLRARSRSAQAHERLQARTRTLSNGGITVDDLPLLAPELVEALETLPPSERDALLLFAWADLTYRDIATALEIPVGTVRSRLHRARRAIRKHLATDTGVAV